MKKLLLLSVLSIFLCSMLNAQPSWGPDQILVPDDYIGYWDFNECGGNLVWNYAAPDNDYPGMIVGAQRMDAGYGRDLNFDGSDWVDIGDIPAYDFGYSTPFTLACWFKFDNTTYNNGHLGNIIAKMRPGIEGWSLGAGKYNDKYLPGGNSGGFRLELNHKWSSHTIILDVLPVDYGTPSFDGKGWGDNQWHFVVATYSAETYNSTGDASPYDITVYVDGQIPSNLLYYDANVDKPMENDARLRIGNRTTGEQNRGFIGEIDEVLIYDYALDQGQVTSLYESFFDVFVECSFDWQDDLVLWLDPYFARNSGGGIASNNQAVKTWDDITTIPEDAYMMDPNRRPVLKENGIGNKRAVKFTTNYGQTMYGFSDITQSPANTEITTGNPDRWNPDPVDKTLLIVFRTGNDVNGGQEEPPYYSDGRMCLFEAGGPLSGYNCYISNGRICFGMWNRFQQKFVSYDGTGMPDFYYPLDPDGVYLAHLEYSGLEGYFRAVVSKDGESVVTKSPWMSFAGLTMDPETALPDSDGYFHYDYTGVGGACRTRYYDYSTGETYSDHFEGYLGEVMLLNYAYTFAPDDEPDINALYQFMNGQYGVNFPVPGLDPLPPTPKQNNDGWVVYDFDFADMSQAQLSDAWPNPFATTTSFSLNIPEAQNVTIEVFDNMGNKVLDIYEGSLGKGIYDFTIDGTGLANGMYIFRATGDGFVKSGKVVLSK